MEENNEGKVIPGDWFLDDTPRRWVANEKLDGDGLSVKHHSLICYVAIIAGCYPDDLCHDLKGKCNQYYQDRKIKSLQVKTENFYKSVWGIEYSTVDEYNEKGEFQTIRKRYIDSNLIEDVTPFIQRWYPSAIIFIQTLNVAPDKLKIIDYYWIYRKIRGTYPQKSMKDYVSEHCPHVNYNTFKDCQRQNRRAEISQEIDKRITPYIRMYYPNALISIDS